MEIICITIEARDLFVCKKDVEEEKESIRQIRSIPLPEELRGKDLVESPKALADFIADFLQKSRVEGKRLAIYLGSCAEISSEYTYSSEQGAKQKKLTAELYSMLGPDSEKYAVASYEYEGEGDNKTALLTAIPGSFCKEFRKALKGAGYMPILLSSSTVAYIERMKPFLRTPLPAIALDVDSESLRVIRRAITGIEHTETVVPEGDDERVLEVLSEAVYQAKKHSEGDTKLILTGALAGKKELKGALGRLDDILLEHVGSAEIEEHYTIEMEDEAEGREEFLPVLLASLGEPPGSIVPNYFEGSGETKKYRKVAQFGILGLACAMIVAFCIPLVHMFMMMGEASSKQELLAGEEYAAVQSLIDDERELTLALGEYDEVDAQLPAANASRVLLLKGLKAELLSGAEVAEMYSEKGGALTIVVSIPRSEEGTFDAAKAKLNTEKQMTVTETGDRQALEGERVRISLKVEKL